MQASESFRWKGRDATRLTNGIVDLIALTGGGHLAGFRLLGNDGRSSQSVFWEPPWTTCDPVPTPSEKLLRVYGPTSVRKFMAGYTGHALCLDYFAEPSAEQAAASLGLNGEAAVAKWNVIKSTQVERPHCMIPPCPACGGSLDWSISRLCIKGCWMRRPVDPMRWSSRGHDSGNDRRRRL
jgi:hypothetical protein